jgi:hypothetical protein
MTLRTDSGEIRKALLIDFQFPRPAYARILARGSISMERWFRHGAAGSRQKHRNGALKA